MSPSAVANPIPLVSTGNTEGPISSTLSGPLEPHVGETLALTLRLDRHLLPEGTPVSIELELPSGALLTQGALHTTLEEKPEQVARVHYTLMLQALPVEDAIISVDAEGAGFGYHAKLAYRFGRAEEEAVAPSRDGLSVRVGARNFGAAVQVPAVP